MIKIVTDRSSAQLTMTTEGLSVVGHPEIMVAFSDSESLVSEAETFLNHVADYVIKSGAKLAAGETMAYGYWMVKFHDAGPDTLETWEYNAQATEFIRGVSLTLGYWKDQHAICKEYAADFQPPRPDKLTVISEGVLEGLPVQGIRYPSPNDMSGWWISTDQYDGNIESLKHEHTYHVTASRPDLAKYLALPNGFRFDLSLFEDIWFDENVANAVAS